MEKTISKVKANSSLLVFPKLNVNNDIRLYLFTDVSNANLGDGVSSAGGYLLFLVDNEERQCLVPWSSTKIKHVVKSTIAAEVHALDEGIDGACFISRLISELLCRSTVIPIRAFVDNKSLVENVNSTTLASEKRLRIVIASVQQSIEKGEVESLNWVCTKSQLADLTKWCIKI